jgi:hypothetical protein
MQYALLFYTTETFDALPPAERQEWLARMNAWRTSLADAGVLRGGLRLAPSATADIGAARRRRDPRHGRAVRRDEGDPRRLHAARLRRSRRALAWARRCPIAQIGTVEVRPEHPDGPVAARAVS